MIATPATTPLKLTVEQFDEWILLPENSDKNWEYIGGSIVEVSSNTISSEVASRFGGRIAVYVDDNDLGFTTGADGGYKVMNERYIPDAAFVSKARQAEPANTGYNLIAPDLAIEVLSPANSDTEIRIKVVNYLRAGTVAWVIDPFKQKVEVYVPGRDVLVLGLDDILEGGSILPGFQYPVRKIFRNPSADKS